MTAIDQTETPGFDPRVDDITKASESYNNLLVSLEMGKYFMIDSFQDILGKTDDESGNSEFELLYKRYMQLSKDIKIAMVTFNLTTQEVSKYIEIVGTLELNPNEEDINQALIIQNKIEQVYKMLVDKGYSQDELGTAKEEK